MSFFVTAKSAVAPANVPLTYVDILYDHAGFLRANNGKLGPGNLTGKTIAIVGAGPAGLAAAYLLQQQGASVIVFEASQRLGGRVYSLHPIPDDPAIFEMGAMRVPPSEQLFGYFAKLFGIKPGGQFPDPGKVNTQIVFQNHTYNWHAGDPAPSIFANVAQGWSNFAGHGVFNELCQLLSDSSTIQEALPLWQKLIYQPTSTGPERGYSTISFYQGLVQAFVENAAKYDCEPWSVTDFSLFGALGIGSGGFGPVYPANFAEIIRLVVNGLESHQQFYPGGLDALARELSNRSGNEIRFGTKVSAVSESGTGSVNLTYEDRSGRHTDTFDAAIVTTTTRSMEIDLGLTNPSVGGPFLKDKETAAIRELHLMNSSKLFVLTKSKFWQTDPSLPQNIQTDGLVRGLYCLDYPDSNFGVVLISYTWGDDSTKLIAVKDPATRLKLLIDSLAPSVPQFVSALRPEILPEHTTLIDWQDQINVYGAFKLNYPGQDPRNQSLYYQFLNSKNGIYLAGDCVAWCGGWIESALQTAVNAAAAVVNQLADPPGLGANSPMTQNPTQYNYGP